MGIDARCSGRARTLLATLEQSGDNFETAQMHRIRKGKLERKARNIRSWRLWRTGLHFRSSRHGPCIPSPRMTQANARLRNFADSRIYSCCTFLIAARLKQRISLLHTAHSDHVGSPISSHKCGTSFMVLARTMDLFVRLSSARERAYKNWHETIPMADRFFAGELFPCRRKGSRPLTPMLTGSTMYRNTSLSPSRRALHRPCFTLLE